jgi:hypothetical protein
MRVPGGRIALEIVLTLRRAYPSAFVTEDLLGACPGPMRPALRREGCDC